MEILREFLQLVRGLGFLALWRGLQAWFGPRGRQSAILLNLVKFSNSY